MALPAAIQRAQEQADAALAAIQNAPQNPVVRDPSQVTVAPAPVAPAPPPEVPPAPQPAPAPAPVDDFKAKYLSLQGKYNAEVPRLNQQLQDALRRLQQLEAAPPPKPADPPEPPKPVATPKEVEDFGAPMLEMVQRQAQQVFSSLAHSFTVQLQGLDVRLKSVEQTVNGVTQQAGQTREELFFTELGRQVPDWEQINESAEWLAWLGEKDPVYGFTRQAALDNARQNLNLQQTVAIFKAFKQPSAPAPSAAPAPPSLAQQVAPPASAGTPPPPSAQAKPIYTQQFLNKFYREVADRNGPWRGREAEAAAIEADIALAAIEGRIR